MIIDSVLASEVWTKQFGQHASFFLLYTFVDRHQSVCIFTEKYCYHIPLSVGLLPQPCDVIHVDVHEAFGYKFGRLGGGFCG